MKTTILSTRIEDIQAKEINKLAKKDGLDKSSFLKKLILKGLNEYKLEHAIEDYNYKKISLSKAAETANLSIHELISLMPEKNMTLNYTSQELKEDLELKI
jgi:predicted HTH domain antitoxin